MVMSLEKYVLLRAKVLEMNSKSLEVGGAEDRRLLRVALGDFAFTAQQYSSDCCMSARSARASGDPWRR